MEQEESALQLEHSCREWLKGLKLSKPKARLKAQEDLFFLCTEVLGFDRLYTPLHKPLCEAFMEAPTVSMWLVPRGHLKTTIFTTAGSIQHKLREPDCRILITTAKMDTTLTMVDAIKRFFIEDNRLTWLFPECKMEEGKGKQGRRHEFNVPSRTYFSAKETCFTGAAVDSSQTSRHFDYMFCDDLVTDRNVKTAEAVQSVKDHWKSLWPLLEPGGKMYIIGTRWDDQDLYGEIIADNAGKKVGVYNPDSGEEEEGIVEEGDVFITVRAAEEKNPETGEMESIFPETDLGLPMYNKAKLKELLKRMRAYSFSCQYMNSPIPDAENRILHQDQVIYEDKEPSGCYYWIIIDPALSTREEADRCAIVVVATDCHRNFHLVEVKAGNYLPATAAEWLHTLYRKWRPKGVFCEDNAWQTMYAQHLRLLIQTQGGEDVPVQGVGRKTTDTAIARILGLQPYFQAGRIHFVRSGNGVEDAVTEIKQWSKKRAKLGRDDICSALSDAPEHCFFPPKPVQRNEWSIQDHWDELEAERYMSPPPKVWNSAFN